jgi:hypothetical protein
MDEAKVHSDAVILFMGSMENGDAAGAKIKPRPEPSFKKTTRARNNYKNSQP